METDFITVLSGVQVTPLSELPDIVTEDIVHVLSILGLRSESDQVRIQRALQLYRIVFSEPQVSHYLPADIVVQDYAGRLPALVGEDINGGEGISTASVLQTSAGPGRVLPSAPSDLAWPYPDTCTIKKLTPDTALFSCGSYRQACTYTQISSNSIAIQLPQEFGIIGNIQLGSASGWDNGVVFLLPIRFKYPVYVVTELLKRDNIVYNLLDKYDFASDFYHADRPEECLALISVALYRELTNG